MLVGAVASVLFATRGNDLFSVKSSVDYWTISFDGLDIMGELDGEHRSGNVVLKTDQNENDVSFHYEGCYARAFNTTNYLEVNENGYVANTTELRSMESLSVQLMGTFRVEWGFTKVADAVQYESSVDFNGGNNIHEFDFDGTHPNYFKITNLDSPSRQLTNFVVKMDKKCEASESPYVVISGVKYVTHSTYAECVGFAGASSATLNIASEAGGLPVTKIADYAFESDTTIETLTLPNTLVDIGECAFRDCTSIGAINIPKSVQYIYGSAFDGTSGCTSLTFESGGTETLFLGIAAFEGNGHSGVLTLPSRVSGLSYDGYIFNAMLSVTSFALNSDNHEENILSVEDGVLFAHMGTYNYYQKVLVSYPRGNTRTEYTIPSDCTRVMERDGLGLAMNIQKLIIDNDVDLYFDADSASSMVNLEEIEFKASEHTVIFYWYALNYAPKLYSLLLPENVVVQSSGLESVNSRLQVYLPGSSIPESWSSTWCGDDVENGYVKVYFHDEVEPATEEGRLTHWHYVSSVPTPYAVEVEFLCYRTDIGDGYAFYLLGVDSWTASTANRGTYNGDASCWEITLIMVPNTTYEFKGAISTWDNPTNITYEVGANRSWTPDRFSHVYEVDWHY